MFEEILEQFNAFCVGIMILCNVLSVYLVGKINGRGTRQSWFQHTLNRSRLDYYYWVLAMLSAINLGLYLLVALFFQSESGSEAEPESEEVEELEFKRLDWFDLLPLRQ